MQYVKDHRVVILATVITFILWGVLWQYPILALDDLVFATGNGKHAPGDTTVSEILIGLKTDYMREMDAQPMV